VVNAWGKRVPASLSISVTDLAQAVPPSDELTILSEFGLPMATLPDTLVEETLYRIQHGFDLQGTFLPTRGKTTAGLITLVQQDANMDLTITTEKDGRFFIPNLLLYDSSSFSIAARTLKGRPGKVVLDSAVLAPPFPYRPTLPVEVYKTTTSVPPYRTDFPMPVTLLEEVSVQTTRITKNRTSLLMADYAVDGQWLRDNHMTDVLSGIQRRVPGLRIIIGNKDGFLTKYLILGGPSSFGGLQTQEPLVLIDGLVVNDMPGGPAAQIERLSVAEIESVEVTKFGNGAAYGARGGNGIIAIHTRRGAPDQQYSSAGTYDKRLLTPLPIKGFSSPRKFTAPDYSTSPPSTAGLDNRATLYWNPDLSFDGTTPCTISFFTSDTGTPYRIVVEGIMADGSPVHGEKIVSAKENP
jgi:hypothetical protein